MLDNIAFGIVIGLLFVSLLVLFCILLVKLHIHKIKNYTQAIHQKDIDHQKSLTTAILETQEQVLHNISQDLHDDAGQQLTFINFLIENFKLDHPEMTEMLDPLSRSAFNLSESIRGISHSLNNQLLMQQNLLKAIQAEAVRLRKYSPLSIVFTVDGEKDKHFSTNEKIVIYRIFQEIINNVMKHAKATAVDIHITTEDGFKMTVTDNGTGFNYSTVKASNTSIGLTNIISRAEIINYSIDIASAPGEGTAITLSAK